MKRQATRSASPKPRKESDHASGPPRPRLFRILLALLYLGALSLLIAWEYHERLDVFSSECSVRDQAKSGFYSSAYSRFLDWARPEVPGQVVTIAITADLEEVQSNLCLSRAYLADLLHALAKQHPAVVVLDKFYSPNACATDPASTRELIAAVRDLPAPVVIGESSNGMKEAVANACLTRRPQLDFDAPNVRHGLARLSADPERLPLRWLVLPKAPDEPNGPSAQSHAEPDAKPESADSLSLAAVTAYDPAFPARPGIQRLLHDEDHAYADVDVPLPRITSSQMLCSANDEGIRRRWHLNCAGTPELPRTLGKVVLIGAESNSDLQHVLHQEMWGFDLQARYIQSLLSGDYLRSLPILLSLALFAVFVFVIEGVPILLLGYLPKWRKHKLLRFAYPRRRYVWVIFWALALIAGSALVSLAFRYLPPLLVYGDIFLVMMTRLMYFSAESAEHPFLHAHHHRKAHPMSLTPHSSASIPPSDANELEQSNDLISPVEAGIDLAELNSDKPGNEGGTPGVA